VVMGWLLDMNMTGQATVTLIRFSRLSNGFQQ